ncbi:MAG: DegV family protein [Chloroflexi bacterium]|nr:MAG: DegV family protein [Chloroflexota bacterium]
MRRWNINMICCCWMARINYAMSNKTPIFQEPSMTKIVADTTSGLPLEMAAQLGIPMIPQIVIFGEQSFRDDTELTTAEFLKKLRGSATLPKTAAPPPPLYNPIFEKAAQTGETVIVVAPSGKVSGTVRSAETAMQDFPKADIRVVDTQTIAGCLGTLVLVAQDLALVGKPADEIVRQLNELIPRMRTFFVLDTLEYLQKGGRIGGAKALLGELLQVKPILQIKDGQVAQFEQARTKKKATGRLIELVCEQARGSANPHLCVMHIDAEDEAKAVSAELTSRLGIKNIPLYVLPPAIVVHAGPKVLAVGFFA